MLAQAFGGAGPETWVPKTAVAGHNRDEQRLETEERNRGTKPRNPRRFVPLSGGRNNVQENFVATQSVSDTLRSIATASDTF